MVDLRPIYIKQLNYVMEIAKDIIKHTASSEIIEHAMKYADIEFNQDEESWWRVNYGEAYAYIEVDKNGMPLGTIEWNNDEMGVECPGTYETTLNDLKNMTKEELYKNSGYSSCYDEEDGKEQLYKCIYKKFKESER